MKHLFYFRTYLDAEKIWNKVWFSRNFVINDYLMKFDDIEYKIVKDKKDPNKTLVMYKWEPDKIIPRVQELEHYKDRIFVFN